MAKKGKNQKRYSSEFKLSVIMDMQEHHLGYRETVRKYWNTQCRKEEDNYKGNLKRWERIYLKEGAEGFVKERRKQTQEGSCEYTDKTKEDLIAENRRLRMEIDYLKKLSALVLAEERKNGKKR